MYPWGDFHSLNLGWFLVQFKEWTEKIQEYLDNGGGTSENLANVIAPVFNAENSYLTGDYVLYNDELYKANQAVNPGTWDPDAWTRCLVTEEMGSGAGGVDNVARLMIAGQYSNTYNYQKYAICRYNDKLWMCNTNLPAGGEEWEPTHWDEITVGAGLTGLRRSVDTLLSDITTLTNALNNLNSDDIANASRVTGITVTDALSTLLEALYQADNNIAFRETGNTASRNFSWNDYIVINGQLYRAITNISQGDTFTIGTNVEAAYALTGTYGIVIEPTIVDSSYFELISYDTQVIGNFLFGSVSLRCKADTDSNPGLVRFNMLTKPAYGWQLGIITTDQWARIPAGFSRCYCVANASTNNRLEISGIPMTAGQYITLILAIPISKV